MQLTDVDTCEGCHADAAAQWQQSAHALSSFNNPIYRASVERFREQMGAKASGLCAGCHDVALLIDGAMDVAVAADDARAHAGISCRVCHGAQSASADGNGSYALRGEGIAIPRKGDATSLRRHREQASLDGLGATLCTSCHRGFVGHASGHGQHLMGMDEPSAWAASAHAGQDIQRVDEALPQRDCIDCHMRREPARLGDRARGDDGRIASHRFLGGHTYLAAMAGDAASVARGQAALRGVARIDIVVVRGEGGEQRFERAPGRRLNLSGREFEVDVVVRNLGVGHRFPGGVRDAQQTWVELEVRDGDGQLLASSGRDADPQRHLLRARAVGHDGRQRLQREVAEFAGVVADSTLAPRDAAVVRYAFSLPAGGRSRGFRLRARLRHRSRSRALAALACEASRDARGRAFSAAAAALDLPVLDGCVEQPTTDIAVVDLRVAADGDFEIRAEPELPPDWQRLYDHGLGLAHGLSDELPAARSSLLAARHALAAIEHGGREAAMIEAALADLATRLGRLREAEEWLQRARRHLGSHPALDRIEADALIKAWRFEEALAPLSRLITAAPRNTAAYGRWAQALGSAGREGEAATAAAAGLSLSPRHVDLLRVQAVSLSALQDSSAESALEAYELHQDEGLRGSLRFACAARSEACERHARPVHSHRALPPQR